MNNRTTGIIVTVIAVLLFGCPGLICLCSGVTAAIFGLSGDPYYYAGLDANPGSVLISGLSIICLSVILIAIPVLVGFFTLRRKPNSDDDEVITIDAEAYEPSEPDTPEVPTDQEEPDEPEEDIPPAI